MFEYAREFRRISNMEKLIDGAWLKFGKKLSPTKRKKYTSHKVRRITLPTCVECVLKVGFGCDTAARRVGVSVGPVRKIRDRLGLKTKRRPTPESVFGWTTEMREQHRRSRDRAYANTPQRKLKSTLSKRIHAALDGRVKKSARTMELVGCDLAFLKRWIERQFKPGMTWENFGEWHIDHKLPCVSFDLTKPEQQRTCFHYSNLRPLWKFDNLSKGAKVLNFQPELPIAI